MDQAPDFLYKSNMRGTTRTAIQSYNLFGETRDVPDVIHCETIAARSVLHDWELEPHRHARLHQVLLIARGGGQITIEGQRHGLRPMDLVNVPIGQVHGFSFKPGTDGWVVTFVAEFIDQVLVPSEGLARILAKAGVLRGTPQMRKIATDIFSEFGARHYARAHVLRSLSAMLLGLVARALAAELGPDVRTPGTDLVRRFEELLDAHVLDHWPVARYADALTVTPTHLTRVVRRGLWLPSLAYDPRSRGAGGEASPRLYQSLDCPDRLCPALRRPGLFQPNVYPGHRPVPARLPRTDRFTVSRRESAQAGRSLDRPAPPPTLGCGAASQQAQQIKGGSQWLSLA